MERDQLEELRSGIDVLVRVLKITDAAELPDGKNALSPSDAQTLIFVASNRECIAADVAKFLHVSATTVSSIIDRLVRRGLLKRERTEANRRIVLLSPTEDGQQATDIIIKEQLGHCERMLSSLSPAERRTFVQLTSKIAADLVRGQ